MEAITSANAFVKVVTRQTSLSEVITSASSVTLARHRYTPRRPKLESTFHLLQQYYMTF